MKLPPLPPGPVLAVIGLLSACTEPEPPLAPPVDTGHDSADTGDTAAPTLAPPDDEAP